MCIRDSPDVACWSPFHGAMYAVVESVVRAVCLGADPDKLRLTLQEYFPKLNNTEVWGQPFSALLGAFTALDALDSVSYTHLDVYKRQVIYLLTAVFLLR